MKSQWINYLAVVQHALSSFVVVAQKTSIEIWDPDKSAVAKLPMPDGTELTNASAAVIKGDPIVVAGNDRGEISVFAPARSELPSCRFIAHDHRSPNLADHTIYPSHVGALCVFEANGKPQLLSTGWEDHAIRRWTLDGLPLHPDPLPWQWSNYVTAMAVDRAADARFLALGDMKGICTVWDLQKKVDPVTIDIDLNARDKDARYIAEQNWIRAIQFASFSGKDAVCVGYRDGTVGVYEPWNGRSVLTFQAGSLIFPNGLAVDSSGRIVVACRKGVTAIDADLVY